MGDAGFYARSGRKKYGSDHCSSARVGPEGLEEAIRKAIADEFIQSEFLEDFVRRARKQLQTSRKDEGGRVRLQRRLDKVERALERWAKVYEQEGYGWETALRRIQALERERAALREALSGCSGDPEAPFEAGEVTDEDLQRMLENFSEAMRAGDINDQRALVALWIGSIQIGPKNQSSKGRSAEVKAKFKLDKSGVPRGI